MIKKPSETIAKSSKFILLAVFNCSLLLFGVGSINQTLFLNPYSPSLIETLLCALFLVLFIITNRGDIVFLGNGKWFFPIAVMMFSGIFSGKLPLEFIFYITVGTFVMFCLSGRYAEQEIFVKILGFLSLVVGISVIGQSLFPDFFAQNIRVLFLSPIQESLSILVKNGYKSGITIQPAYASIYIAIGIGVVFSKIKKENFLTCSILLLLLLFAELQTAKRMVLMAVIIACLVVYLLSAQNANKRILAIIKTILLVFCIYSLLSFMSRMMANDLAIARVFNSINDVLSGKSVLSQRYDLWMLSLDLFWEHPFFGAGWGSIASRTVGLSATADSLASHNSYIQLLAETGIIGTAFYLFPFVTTYFNSIKNMTYFRKQSGELDVLRYTNCKLSVYLQTIFFIYAVTENPVNEIHMYLLFLIATVIGASDRDWRYRVVFRRH